MTPSEDRRGDAADETLSAPLPGPDPGPSPEAVTGVVRVSRRREQAAAAAGPAAAADGPPSPTPVSSGLADATFATVWRGYDTAAVDAYVRQVSRALAELEDTRTPQDVVRRALDRVGEETSAILREAEEAAQRITTKSRADAAERVQRAEHEAHEITQRARSRLRELDVDIDRIWIERQRIIDDTRKLADGLGLIADHAEERFPAEELELAPNHPRDPGAPPRAPGPAAALNGAGAGAPEPPEDEAEIAGATAAAPVEGRAAAEKKT